MIILPKKHPPAGIRNTYFMLGLFFTDTRDPIRTFRAPRRMPPELHTKCMRKHPNVIIFGDDFNVGDIAWDRDERSGTFGSINARKLVTIKDYFSLFQH